MSNKSINNVRLGFFVIVSTILFIVAIYLIGNNQNLFGKTFHLSSSFQNVAGLKKGNNVRFNGINVGTVEHIDIVNDTLLKVYMILDHEVQPYIKKDALANISSDGLVGNMIINITSSHGTGGPVEDGDEIPSYSRINADEMFSTLGSTSENVALISRNLVGITDKMNQEGGLISLFLQDSGLVFDVKESMRYIRSTTVQLTLITKQLNSMINEIKQGKGLLGKLYQDSILVTSLDRSVLNVDTAIHSIVDFTRGLNPILTDLKNTGKNLDTSANKLRQTLLKLEQDGSTINYLLTDTLMKNEIRQTLQNLNQGTAKFNENMKALESNFLFRRYYRKKAKADSSKVK